MTAPEVVILPALSDNYIYLLAAKGRACVIDPSVPGLVKSVLAGRGLTLDLVLNTHAHADHCGGNQRLRQITNCEIIAASPQAPAVSRVVSDHETISWQGFTFQVLATPGHTHDSVCYYLPNQPGLLFTGDTLFVGGCGRVFDGTAQELWASLQRLAALPADTRVYCGHEYAEENYAFAESLGPGHPPRWLERAKEIRALRARNLPTVPTTLALELAANPFMAASGPDFIALRSRKNSW
jgi:hydroxyacylglutathione hydrolase